MATRDVMNDEVLPAGAGNYPKEKSKLKVAC
jgi:hypothetical protein